ncbi:MAG: hypothetical protein AB8F78_11985 [Saprospiraceae bacterium]
MNNLKITLKYILVGIFAVFLTWIIHEFTHWLTGELLGLKSTMRLNGTSFVKGQNPSEIHQAIISISGPIITVLQGFLAFLFLKARGWNKYIYTLLFTAFYMRFLAGLMNFIMANDEGRVGQFLGIGTFTLSIIISGILFFMVYRISEKYKLNRKFQFWTTIIIISASSFLIFLDQFFKFRIL